MNIFPGSVFFFFSVPPKSKSSSFGKWLRSEPSPHNDGFNVVVSASDDRKTEQTPCCTVRALHGFIST